MPEQSNEPKYNVIIGISFNGDFIAYSHGNGYAISLATLEDLKEDKKLIFHESEIYNLYKEASNEEYAIKDIKQCTFKVGQADMLNNPFKK